MSDKTKVAVLVSGGGTNLQALIDKIAAGELPEAEIVEVISSKEGAFALERAARAGIPTAVAKSQADVLAELKRSGAEMIVLAGYMKVLVENGASVIGGCCGTTPEFISETARVLGLR